jgi:cholesterol oxidase
MNLRREFFSSFPREVSAEEMQPYFERVRRMLRPAPVPAPPEKDRVFEEAVSAADLPTAEYPNVAIVWGQDPAHPQRIVNAAGVEQSSSTWQSDVFVGCDDGSKTTLPSGIPVANLIAACEPRLNSRGNQRPW